MRSSPGKIRRAVGLSAVGAIAAAALVPLGITGAAAVPEATDASASTISSQALQVTVSRDFPQVLKYTEASTSATLDGATKPIDAITINGETRKVEVTSKPAGESAMDYRITVPEIPGAVIKARISVEDSVMTFRVTEITDGDSTKIRTLGIPGNNLVSVSSTNPGAQVSTANLSVDRAKSGDTFTRVSDSTPLDTKPQESAFALANTDKLAAALESNSLYDTSSGSGYRSQGRFQRQAVKDGEHVRVGISSGDWLYRAKESNEIEELPWSKVKITADANADGTVDWQDAAIALRDIAVLPHKGEDVKDKVVQRIPFNFASQATHPFLRTLDDTKRIALATDGLGQSAILKGFGNEGHDSANTDFADNYNTRAGGLGDLNQLLEASKKWNASYGVHINQTEAYPESKFFSDDLVDPKAKGWSWLDQSYYINQRKDILTGNLAERVKKFREQTSENLDMVYVDVYYQYGWLAERLQKELVKNGFRVSSEWAHSLDRNNTWSHWATDEKYGGSNNKGVNSDIIRFALNSQKDTWNPHPLLGNANIVEWEGWTGQNDYNAFYQNIWKKNLPAKFLQQQEIVNWEKERIDLTGGVSVTGTSAGDRVITDSGAEVLRGDSYLLPWAADGTFDASGDEPTKLYHYSAKGGTSTWTLPERFRQNGGYKLYKLTDTGRELVDQPKASKGKITLRAEAGQPYVLAHDARPALPQQADFGQGTGVTDPGFNSGTLESWNPAGSATVERNDKGHSYAVLGEGTSAISQKLGKLEPGTYSVGAWVEVEKGKSRETTLSVQGQGTASVSNTIHSSRATNYVAADEKHGTNFQRLRVLVEVKESGSPELRISVSDGTAKVRIDDVRVVATAKVPTSGVISEDFEDIDQGWGPFVKGNAGGSTDPRTHLAELNAPYTQSGWNSKATDDVIDGKWSLKSHAENKGPGGGPGLVYRTSNYTVPMTPGHEYRVGFDYQNALAGEYNWVGGYASANGTVKTQTKALPRQLETARFTDTVVAGGCGDTWVGLERVGSSELADFSLDNLLVEDLGAAASIPACGQVDVALEGDVIKQDQENTFTTTFTSDEPADIKDLEVALELPEGWRATAKTANTAATLAPGAKLETTWAVVPPASADGDYTVGTTASYFTTADPVGTRTVSDDVAVYTLPAPPAGTVYASDHQWVSADNGWGPVEKDKANGENGEGDGPAITLNGVVYPKGLGAHAPSTVRYFTGGKCSSFTAQVGIDDVQKTLGSVGFTVLADGKSVAASPVMRATSATHALSADITGAEYVDLVADVAGDGNGNDHADWADAKFTCK
ncbi:endo-alpha-N-acetylgalactosaminidase [Arthrobacter sp. AQ5-05]|uniref:endo-alpha-N-acetylgalactosaminidase family protein n=1 Tax=Arthrobacter sp. AQ5-05 TaxID=2184581 RepID=UPI000DCB3697|nr:endo-alpha-N-acetylgalactosaminidase family protein [Arthrobacter sp. AQ5-05]RAX50569.1 endo-alpha-N-acetylgalactosaminidase [Arthrobacter sp. AQ5-05]